MDDEALETDTLKGKKKKSIPFKTFFLELSVLCINQDLQVHSDKQKQKKGKCFPSPPYYPMQRCFNIQQFTFAPDYPGKLDYRIPRKQMEQRDTKPRNRPIIKEEKLELLTSECLQGCSVCSLSCTN